jgi:hypothetical protein
MVFRPTGVIGLLKIIHLSLVNKKIFDFYMLKQKTTNMTDAVRVKHKTIIDVF